MEVEKATPTQPGGKTQGVYADVEEYPKDSENLSDNQTFEGEKSHSALFRRSGTELE